LLRVRSQDIDLIEYEVGNLINLLNHLKIVHRAASPLTYAAQVKAPILVIQGRNDTRCPARQMQAYEAKLKELGKAIQVEWFDAGHLMGNNEQSIHHQELKLRFAQQVLQQPQSNSR
jgi:dipeptidyl aminopeptidase/acylaminoacyl peptidase